MQQHDSEDGPKAGDQGDSVKSKPPAQYLTEARALLRNGQKRKAYGILLQAMELNPEHPVILSYCGWLRAVVDKKPRSGITLCRKSFVVFKTSNPHTASVIYPVLYLNLGKAFYAAGKRKEAVENFEKGLTYDRGHFEIKKEMQRLGMRKKPIVPFLSRSNPVNKYLGILRNQRTA